MAWDTKTSTQLASAMIAQAVAVEYLRGLTAEARKAAAERMSTTLQASVKQFAAAEVGDPALRVKHKIMIDDLERSIDPMLKALLDLAGNE